MKSHSLAAPGFVADGFYRYTRNEAFRARKQAVCCAILADFAPKLGAECTWLGRVRLRWQMYRELRRATRQIYPSAQSCFFSR